MSASGGGIFIDTAPSVPTTEDTTTRALPGTKDVTKKALSPEQLAVMGQQDALQAQQDRTATSQLSANVAKNAADADEASQKAAAVVAAGNERISTIKASQQNIDLWASKLRQAQDKFTSAPMPSLFHSGDDGRNVLKGLGLLLANIGDARKTTAMMLAHQSPGEGSAVDDIITRDFAIQRAQIDKLKDNVVMAQSGLKNAEEGRQLMLANIDVKQAAVYDRIAALAEARRKSLAVTGAPGDPASSAAQLEYQKLVNENKDKAVKLRMQSVDGLATSTTEKVGGTTSHTSREVPPKQNGNDSSRIGVIHDAQGNPIGTAPSGIASDAATETAARLQVNSTMRELREHMQKYGNVAPGSKEWVDRNSLFAAAKIAVGSVSYLGKSDEALKTETEALGPPGTGTWSPSIKAIDRVINHNVQAEHNQEKLRTSQVGGLDSSGRPLTDQVGHKLTHVSPTTPPAPSTPAIGGTGMVQIDPTPEHPHGGVGFTNTDGTKEIRWNR